MRASRLDGDLRARIVGLAESLPGPSWIAILIEDGGRCVFQSQSGDPVVSGPALVWRPWHETYRVVFTPGSIGTYVIVGATALANAIGHMPESRDLRDVADRPVSLALPRSGEAYVAMSHCFSGIHREVHTKGPASRAVVDSYLRIVLVELMRTGATALAGTEQMSPSQRIFNRFSGLVELHYSDRWNVADYAAALGVSRDRLGDICRRVRGIGPKELVDRRVALEARLHLENSANSIQQIAGLLGFQSPAQFNRFFKRTVGSPPGWFRSMQTLTGDNAHTVPFAHHHDWP